MTKKNDFVRMHVWVKGRVQAVGFRAHVEFHAGKIGVPGWVRNVGHDTVEAVAEGTQSQIEEFLSLIKRGPNFARVDESREEWEQVTGEYQSFKMKVTYLG